MKLTLSFVHPGKPAKVLGPFASVCLDRENLRVNGDQAPIARHTDHQWLFGNERYFRLDASQPVTILFQGIDRRSRAFGPFKRFSLVDGVAYVDHRVFAYVKDEPGVWFSYDDGQHWPQMLVYDASAAPTALALMAIGLAPLLSGAVHEPALVAAAPATARLAARARRCIAPYPMHARWTRTRTLVAAAAASVAAAHLTVRQARALRALRGAA